MVTRYVVTSRTPDEAVVVPEDENVRFVAALDRGVLIDADEGRAEELAAAGLRVKALPDPHTINMFSYTIDTATGELPRLPGGYVDLPPGDGPEGESDVNHLVQLVGPVQESWLAVLAERGVRVIESVGPFGFYVRADADTVAGLEGLPFVQWAGRLEPAYKVNPALVGDADADAVEVEEVDPESAGLGEIEAVDIGVLADGDVDGVAARIEELGGEIQGIGPQTADAYRSITAVVPREAYAVLAARDDVRWIDIVRAPLPEDERTAQIAYEDLDAAVAPDTGPVTGYAGNLAALGADGSGVTIVICDSGIDTNDPTTVHADLAGRLAFSVNSDGTALAGGDTNGHGTHVAGIAAGNGATGDTDPEGFVLGQGVAPGATVGGIRSNGNRSDRIETAIQNGADVMNNSYALDGSNYGAGDRTFDLGVRDADPNTPEITPLVIVFSAGNSGPNGTTCTKAAKNAFVVGNSLNFRPDEGDIDDIRGLRASSSRGPAGDGRQLPNLVAPGTNVVSALSTASTRAQYADTDGVTHANHTQTSGTSMAAPVVSGMSAVLIDWWRQTRNGATPSPALLRSWLVGSCESVSGGPARNGGNIPAGPNNEAGWGRVSLENSLLQAPASDRGPKIFLDQRHAFTATGQEYRIRVAANDPTRPLRIALTWTDAAGTVGVTPNLVNDLDLEVFEVATGDLYRGNVFNGDWSTTGGAADSLNNIECAFIQNPNGVYEVTVVGANIAASARTDIATPWQDFALVIDNAEVPSADPVSVAMVLDRSTSMQTYGYVDVTRQSSRQFIDLMSVDDSVGVVSFGSDAVREYPAAGPPELIVGPATRNAAKNAVDSINFGGCTYMGDGINVGGAMLSGAGSRRALVLLSDGYDNKGCDSANPAKPSALDAAAALPADLPIYSCAMGPSSDQTLLEQLATDTDGRYYFMPTIDDLFEIYNYIRGQVTGDGIIVNESSTASRSAVSGFVDACADSVLFTVAWHDPALRYVPREPNGPGEISVRLRAPGGRWLPHSTTEYVRTEGDGYISFEMHDPQPGAWTVEVATDLDTHTPYTVGGFVRSDIGLTVEVPSHVTLGEPVPVTALVTANGKPVSGTKVRATVAAPRHDIDDLLKEFADQLDRVDLPDDFRRDGDPDDRQVALARLVVLRDRIRAKADEDILGRSMSKLTMSTPSAGFVRPWQPGRLTRSAVTTTRTIAGSTSLADRLSASTVLGSNVLDLRNVLRPRQHGLAVGRFDQTKLPGSYSIAVTAAGYSEACRSRFVRHDLVSVLVARRD